MVNRDPYLCKSRREQENPKKSAGFALRAEARECLPVGRASNVGSTAGLAFKHLRQQGKTIRNLLARKIRAKAFIGRQITYKYS